MEERAREFSPRVKSIHAGVCNGFAAAQPALRRTVSVAVRAPAGSSPSLQSTWVMLLMF